MDFSIGVLIHIIVMIVSLIMAVVYLLNSMLNQSERELSIAVISLITCVVAVIFMFVGAMKCESAKWKTSEEPYAVEKIVSLNDNNLTQGHFYMRRGQINEDLYYQYMVQLGNGGFVANKVNSRTATIFSCADNYRVEWFTKEKRWLYWVIKEKYQKIYIPEGSITDDYSIDLR